MSLIILVRPISKMMGPKCISSNQEESVEECVKENVASIFLTRNALGHI